MKKTMPKKKSVYVYHDGDHGDIELFTTLEAAKAYTEVQWPCDGADAEELALGRWEGDIDAHGEITDLWSQYVVIYKREIHTEESK